MQDTRVKVGQIIGALVKRAKRSNFKQVERDRWLAAARGVLGTTALDTLDFTKEVSFGLIFGIGKGKNLRKTMPKYTSAAAKDKRKIQFHHLQRIFLFLAPLNLCPPSTENDLKDDRSSYQWLNNTLEIIQTGATSPSAVQLEPLEDNSIRLISRPSCRDQVINKLNQLGAAAIVGMSGIGKTVLAQQVLATVCDPSNPPIYINARHWLEHALSLPSPRAPDQPTDHIALAAELLAQLARCLHGSLTPSRRSTFGGVFNDAVQKFLTRWSLDPELNSEQSTIPQQNRYRLLNALHNDHRWTAFLNATSEHVGGIRDIKLLGDLATVLRIGASHIVVCIDDVWSFAASRDITAKLFGRKGGEFSPRLLVTSTEKNATDFLVPDATVDLDITDDTAVPSFDPTFAWQVVVAWSAPDIDLRTHKATEAFRQKHLEADEQTKRSVDLVISRLTGHPLALAVIAATWRVDHRHDSTFWGGVCDTLDTDPEFLLSVRHLAELGDAFDERHHRVLAALRFGWRALDKAAQEQYLDLAIVPENVPIDEVVFHAVWRPLQERRQSPPPAIARPLRRFVEKSLLKRLPRNNGYILHDLHRSMIKQQIGPHGLASRHRTFLDLCGLLDAEGRPALDEHRDFQLIDGDRTILSPNLGKNATDSEVRHVGRYLLEHLPHHIQAISTDRQELFNCVATFRLLQALLDDAPVASASPLPISASLRNVWSALTAMRASEFPDAELLARTIRLVTDRKELGPQLLARISKGRSRNLDRILDSASRYCPTGALKPRFALLDSPSRELLSSFQHSTMVHGAQPIDDPSGSPIVLTWSEWLIKLWNPATGEEHLVAQNNQEPFACVKWLPDWQGNPVVFSCTVTGKLCIWDLVIGPLPLCQFRLDQRECVHDVSLIPVTTQTLGLLLKSSRCDSESWRSPRHGRVSVWFVREGHQEQAERQWLKEFFTTSVDQALWVPDAPGGPAIFANAWKHTPVLYEISSGREREWLLMQRTDNPIKGARWVSDALGAPAVLGWQLEPDGPGSTETIRLWDPVTGRPRATRQMCHQGLYRLEWVPTAFGKPVIISFGESKHSFWPHSDTPEERTETRPRALLWDPATGDEQTETLVEPDPNSLWIRAFGQPALLSWDWPDGRVYVSAATTTQPPTPRAYERYVKPTFVEDAPVGPAILTVTNTPSNGLIRLRRFGSNQADQLPLMDHGQFIASVKWIQHGFMGKPTILSWSMHRLILWDPLTARKLSTITGSSLRTVEWLANTPWGSVLMIEGLLGLTLLQPETGEEKFRHDCLCYNAEWIPDALGGPAILNGDRHLNALELWDPVTATRRFPPIKLPGSHDMQSWRTCWIPNAPTSPAIVTWIGTSIIVWDACNGSQRAHIRTPCLTEIRVVEWIPPTAGGPAILIVTQHGIYLWDFLCNAMSVLATPQDDSVFRLASWIPRVFDKPGVLAWTQSSLLIGQPPAFASIRLGYPLTTRASCISDSPLGPVVLTWGGPEITLTQITGHNPRQLASMRHDGLVLGVHWLGHPKNSPLILSWSSDTTVRLWNPATGEEISRFILGSPIASVDLLQHSQDNSISFAACCYDGTAGVFDFAF